MERFLVDFHDKTKHSYSVLDGTTMRPLLITTNPDSIEGFFADSNRNTPGRVFVLDVWHPVGCDCDPRE